MHIRKRAKNTKKWVKNNERELEVDLIFYKHYRLKITTHLGTESTEDEDGTLETWQFAAAASFKADDGTALKVLGICRAFMGAIEFTVATDEGTVNLILFPIRTWVVAELAAVTWWLSALWEPEVCVVFEGCNKAEPAVDGLVCTSAVGVVLLRCKPLYTPRKKKEASEQGVTSQCVYYRHCYKDYWN